MIACTQNLCGQTISPATRISDKLPFKDIKFLRTDSGLIIISFFRDACKNYSIRRKYIPNDRIGQVIHTAKTVKEFTKPKFVTIHGNISYDFFYRSKIDTPFIQPDLKQHVERVWLNILIKEKYPFQIGFTARQSNSPFFRDLFSMNLSFDRSRFNKNVKQDLLNRLNMIKVQNPNLKIIDAALSEKLERYQFLKTWLNGRETFQRILEERERAFYNEQKMKNVLLNKSLPIPEVYNKIKLNNGQFLVINTDSVLKAKKDTILSRNDSSFAKILQNKRDELDKLERSIASLRRQSDSLRTNATGDISKLRQSIYRASSPKELEHIAAENGIYEPKKEKLQTFLSNIKTLGVGRTMVDYTELTVQNVMLTGINIEYNPSYYAAFAAGKVDYGFRDFFGKELRQKNQYLVFGRMGWGNKDKRSVILTLFNGRKNNYPGLLTSDSSSNTAGVFGYSIETILKKDENTFFSVEVAKSTKNGYGLVPTEVSKADNLVKFSDITNMGLNIKAQKELAQTDTKLTGFFRKTGRAFQSFSSFTYNTNQQAWQVKADQSFLKRKIDLTAMLRQDNFANPLVHQTFKTNTVFKALQLKVKINHWPTINAGYYPGSQYYIIDDNTVRENVYYILNGSVAYTYVFRKIAMTSSFLYNRYFNKATDSGFISYKGINYILSQSLLIKKLQLEGSYTYNKQSDINYYTINLSGDCNVKEYFRIGVGTKFNRVQDGRNYWGQTARLQFNFQKFGSLQLSYEKSYLPTIQQTLYPMEIGRVGLYKSF